MSPFQFLDCDLQSSNSATLSMFSGKSEAYPALFSTRYLVSLTYLNANLYSSRNGSISNKSFHSVFFRFFAPQASKFSKIKKFKKYFFENYFFAKVDKLYMENNIYRMFTF